MKNEPTLDLAAVVLGKDPLSVRLVGEIARRRRRIVVDGQALDCVSRARDALISVVESGDPVYGVTHGVGQNVDRKLLPARQKYRWEEVRNESIAATRGGEKPFTGGTKNGQIAAAHKKIGVRERNPRLTRYLL